MHPPHFIVLTALCFGGAISESTADEGSPSPSRAIAILQPPIQNTEPSSTDTPAVPASLFPDCFPDRLYDHVKTFKDEFSLPVGIGAWHWEHINSGGPNRTGYGIPPNVAGTFFWYLTLDPELKLDVGPFSKIGAHAELRIREEGLFRPYFSGRFWSYEAYLWADSEVGRFKVGQIVRQFGLPGGGDGSFWATVPFWDGFNLNPSYGAAWEKKWKGRDDFSIDATAQFFLADDGVAGAAVGGSPESAPGARTPTLGVLRVVPTLMIADKSTLAVGFSGSVGRVEHIQPDGSGDTLAAWAIDATYSWNGLRLFGEVLQSHGVLNPTRYVSGGPSRRVTDLVAGAQYVCGPATFRFTYSAGFDENPSGWQQLWVPGVTVALTKNIDFYAEFVRWDGYQASDRKHTVFENGVQLVVNWRF